LLRNPRTVVARCICGPATMATIGSFPSRVTLFETRLVECLLMPWLLLGIALFALAAGFPATSVAAVLGFLLLGLLTGVAGVILLLARRVAARSQDASAILDPEQLRRLHERAEAERSAA